MRLPQEQLENHLQRELRTLYVICGDEPLALMESVDMVRSAARRQGYDERNTLLVERSFNWEQLTACSQALSLFASRRLVEIRIPSGKPGTEGSKALQAYVADLPPDTITAIVLPKLDKPGLTTAWFSALEKAGTVVMIQPVEIDRLPRWISARLEKQGQQADEATLDFIANQVEGNLLAAYQEIQKLGLLEPQGRLDAEAVREAVLNVSRYDAFQLGDAMLAGDAARAVARAAGPAVGRRAAAGAARYAGLAAARRDACQTGPGARRKLGKCDATGQNLGRPPGIGKTGAGTLRVAASVCRDTENGGDRQDGQGIGAKRSMAGNQPSLPRSRPH